VLSPVERSVAAAVEAGGPLDLRAEPDRAVRAQVLRDLVADGAGGVRLTGAEVVGALDLAGLRIGGPLRLVECDLTAAVMLRDAHLPLLDLRRSRLVSLSVTEATIERVLLLSGIEATGRVALDGARVGATCTLQGATLRCADGPALVADRLRLASDLLLDRLHAEGRGPQGAIRLQGARVDGRISGHGLRLANPAGPALVADNLHVADTIYLSEESELRGTGERGAVRIVGARAGSLSLGQSTLENPDGWALAAHYLQLTGTLYLDQLRAVGGIRLSGSRIGGRLDLVGAVVDGGTTPALLATRIEVAQEVSLNGAAFRSAGDAAAVDLRSARIAGDLDAGHTRVANPDGVALRLNTATVQGRAVLSELVVERGGLDFRDTAVGAFYDDPASALPAEDGFVELSGLTYRGVPGHPGVRVAERLAWLARMPAYAAQPYRQLAAAYQAAGHEDEARRVLVAQQRHLHRSLSGWARLRHRLFGLILQYGYQPARAVAVLAAVLAVAVGLFLGLPGGTRTPGGGAACVAVDRIGLAVDTSIPLVSTGAADRCQLATGTASGQGLAAAGWVLTLLGWASATLVVAGYSGWVRRR
jgi:hypothetical protein